MDFRFERVAEAVGCSTDSYNEMSRLRFKGTRTLSVGNTLSRRDENLPVLLVPGN